MTSTSFMSGTGFMKCMPMTLSGRLVAAAIFVIGRDEVFVARIAPGFTRPSSVLNSSSLTSSFSTAASTTIRLEALAEADVVIEAIVEDETVKKELFRRLDAACKPGAILASNTSSISITRLAAATRRPEAFIGMHFMNPVPVMQLVEVIRGIGTSDATAAAVDALARRMGKTPIQCHDYPGFISNRVLMPMINEAIEALREGVATREAIDGIMKLGMNHPMGPLTLADFIGLDTCLSILRVLQNGFGDPKYRPSPLLVRMVDAGWLGKKSGKGFYEYPSA